MNTLRKSDGSDASDASDPSDMSDHTPRVMPPSGGYRRLRSFQSAQLVYDATVVFCDRFVDKRSRTRDQMVQAARSGVQNIAEGSMASATSKKTELKLTGVARASLEELLLDYEDFLRQRGLRIWDKNSPQALAVRGRYQADVSDQTTSADPYGIGAASPDVAANTLICLINQASYLLGRQLHHLEQAFIEHGGFTERLYQARSEFKRKSEDLPPAPVCPSCGKPMTLRTARKGPRAGQPFWGCSAYPDCTGTRSVDRPGDSNQPNELDRPDSLGSPRGGGA